MESEKGIVVSRYKTSFGMNLHTHDYFEMEYVFSGKCHQVFKKKSHEFSRGDVALFKTNSRHEFYSSNEAEVFKIIIKPELLPKIYNTYADEFKESSIIHLPSNEVRRVENILLMIEKEFNTQNEFFMDIISGYLEILFTLFIRINRMNEIKKEKVPTIDFKIFLSYIDNNLKTVTPSSVANYSGYNFPYFSKLFKKNVGMNLSEYINLKKLETAAKILIETDISIENIGYDVGFNHKSYFHRVFKRYYGVTPEEYRHAGASNKK
jgi:AraC-like DNA-binding protein